MRLLIDMNLSPAWVEVLKHADIEAVHWSAVGERDAEDIEIMDYAREHDCIVVTHDLDFGTLLAHSRKSGPSVVQMRTQDLKPAISAPMLVAALGQFKEALAEGALVTIFPDRAKVRVLPL